LATALLGGEVTVATIEGHVAVKIPAGTQPETQFRVRGQGFPRLHGGNRGDFIVTVHVDVPRSLTSRQRDFLRQAFLPEDSPTPTTRDSLFRRRKP
jgi:molecular chaperone DnaJ